VPDRPEPRLVSRTEPAISRKGLKRVAGQSIVLRVLVNDSGGISRVVVDQGIPGSEAEAAAITAVLGWHYEPATRDGAPVESWTTARFDFD